MASKKSANSGGMAEETATGTGPRTKQLEDRRKRRLEATTVNGTESFPPPGMDLEDGGQVPLDADESA